ncbi:MAG: trypsin-like peptidase domain-containing protein [Roseitalea sp.]|nr:trypsin-like peptidase domain-containing protein [Roseitalea sp.]MBO6952097.1 trypsin-like peptidase domain-containing protein [Rhizobiaceae bacterium]MBO6592057.1 trypsin-like peptidase domain-containing protein [Roseitalea sp.]MBO6598312.1 trypsin-like peptidase domain-containing protein [Roseitalea sp.]MBO6610758.1 trypsin-like peptidase domain-containing protein [Roseitalea sp.]
MRSFFSRFSFLPYLLVAFFFTSNDAHADECAFFFGKRDLSPSEMEQRYEKSLLYINDNDARGTAFLIDADGLYLTAAHVVMKRVEQRRANGQAPFVFARNPLVGEGRLKLELVDVFAGGQSSDDGQLAYQVDDLALLRLIDFELPADANPLELAIRKPRSRPERDRVRFTGYGIVRPEAPVAPRIIDNSEWDLARLEEGVYRIAASVDGGDSGGPVFLRNGNVIGLVLRQMGSGQALVHPMYRYEDRLINVFRLENDVSSFVERLVSHSSGNSIERREIAMLFQDGSVSNIEWVTAIREMKLKDSISRLDRELLSCPLIKAAEEREIGQYASIMIAEFLSRQWADLPAPEILNRAVSLEAGGDLAVAAAAYDLAIDAYRRELASILGEGGAQRAFAGLLARASSGDRSLEYESELAALAGRLGVKSPDNIVVNVSPENIDRFKTYTSDRLAVALHDFARAASRGQFVTDAMSGSGHADYFLFSEGTTDAAITAAAVGSAVGTSPQWRALNADTLFYAASGNPDIAEQLSNGVPSEQFLFDLATGQSS